MFNVHTVGYFAENGQRHDLTGSFLDRLEPSLVQLVLRRLQILGQLNVQVLDLHPNQ